MNDEGELSSVHYPGSPLDHVVSVSGAGDCLTAGFITGALQVEGGPVIDPCPVISYNINGPTWQGI